MAINGPDKLMGGTSAPPANTPSFAQGAGAILSQLSKGFGTNQGFENMMSLVDQAAKKKRKQKLLADLDAQDALNQQEEE